MSDGSELGTLLGLWAHPDDEAYGSAGLMAAAVDAGRRVVCVTATHGELGFPADTDLTVDERTAIRSGELEKCLAVLGVTEHRFLGFADGGCRYVSDEDGAAALAAAIVDAAPDTVLTFGPEGGTGHPDHIAVCRWATLAAASPQVRALARPPRLLYATKSVEWTEAFTAGMDTSSIMMAEDLEPEQIPAADIAVHFHCDDAMAARKLAALRAQASQVEPFLQAVGEDAYVAMFRDEFFRDPLPTDAERIISSRTLTFRT